MNSPRTSNLLRRPSLALTFALLALAVLIAAPRKAAAATCPEGICPCSISTQYDVVDWMFGTKFESNPNGYMANTGGTGNTPIYPTLWPQTSTAQGKIWYSKGIITNDGQSEGYAWDVNTYDSSNVYFALTNPQGTWTFPNYRQYADPQTSTGFYPIAPRCVSNTATGKLYDHMIPYTPTDDTGYFAVNNCVAQPTQYLGGADMQLWAPTTYSGLPDPINGWTLMNLLYNYGWNTTANNWNSVEKFYFSETYGWVAWELWTLESGTTNTYTKTNSAYMGQYEATGNVPPAQPGCGS
jgi:hypothetical protein